MSGPSTLCLKRKVEDLPPDALIIERDAKRATGYTRYIRQDRREAAERGGPELDVQNHGGNERNDPAQQRDLPTKSEREKQDRRGVRRTFRLRHMKASVGGKRASGDEGVATFVERMSEKHDDASRNARFDSVLQPDAIPPPSGALKPPSRRAAIRNVTSPPVPAVDDLERKRIEVFASIMHQAALDEIEHESRRKRVAVPKLSGQRSKDIHRHRANTNGSAGLNAEMDIDDESNYVYDTYVLAASSDDGAMQVDANSEFDSIGYLVISEEDQSLWETYLEDEPSDKDWNSDEEDENAEDFYGADYPEDELEPDDEFGRNAYGFRGGGGSDDEEWDEDTGAYSDDEYERMMQPFSADKTPRQSAKYLADGGDYD